MTISLLDTSVLEALRGDEVPKSKVLDILEIYMERVEEQAGEIGSLLIMAELKK